MRHLLCLAWLGAFGIASGAVGGETVVTGRFSGANPVARATRDFPFRHDLRRASGVAFTIRTDAPEAFSSFSAYFRSGAGWYTMRFTPGAAGRRMRVVVRKEEAGVEGKPSGWGAVDLFRISGWRGGTNDASFVVSDFAPEGDDADALVVQAISCRNANPSEAESCTSFAARLTGALTRTGARVTVLADSDLDTNTLAGVKAVFLPYNPKLPPANLTALRDFSARGGRIFAAYNCDAAIADLLGVKRLELTKANTPDGRYDGFVRVGAGLPGQPAFAEQHSWYAFRVAPGADAQVIAHWRAGGKETDIPALVRSARGIYAGHVWLGGAEGAPFDLLCALAADLMPDCAARMAAAKAEWIRGREAEIARVAALPAGPANEFRAFWCHNARGLPGKTWDESAALLKASGFNTLIVNLAWGGSAAYPSRVLPRSSDTADGFDAFDECRRACRKHGIAFHVWKVCWNIGRHAPEDFVRTVRENGRAQVGDPADAKTRTWLCPTHPANLALETEALVELAKKRPDGIHFDYIRYPNSNYCFCEGCRARFEQACGAKVAHWPGDVRTNRTLEVQWRNFRCAAISALVSNVAVRVRREAPGVRISAAVFENPHRCPNGVGQDWPAWCRAGWLDFVCPMDYTNSAEMFRGIIRRQRPFLAGVSAYPGIGLSATGSTPGDRLTRVADQIVIAREEGYGGFTVFNFDAAALQVLPVLARGLTAPAK